MLKHKYKTWRFISNPDTPTQLSGQHIKYNKTENIFSMLIFWATYIWTFHPLIIEKTNNISWNVNHNKNSDIITLTRPVRFQPVNAKFDVWLINSTNTDKLNKRNKDMAGGGGAEIMQL